MACSVPTRAATGTGARSLLAGRSPFRSALTLRACQRTARNALAAAFPWAPLRLTEPCLAAEARNGDCRCPFCSAVIRSYSDPSSGIRICRQLLCGSEGGSEAQSKEISLEKTFLLISSNKPSSNSCAASLASPSAHCRTWCHPQNECFP